MAAKPNFSKKILINEVKRALTMNPDFEDLDNVEQLERIGDLMAYGPMAVKQIDVSLAYLGFIEIYDQDAGNESVDIEGDVYKSMHASDILERASERFYGTKRRNA